MHPLTALAVSSSGRYVAVAGEETVLLCEPCAAGFLQVAICTVSSGSTVNAISFFDANLDSAALLATAGDLCIGWEPLKASAHDQDPMS